MDRDTTHPPAESASSLPQWTVPLLLAGLAGISGLIVLVGWLLASPAHPIGAEPKARVEMERPIPPLPTVTEPVPIPAKEPPSREREPSPSPALLQRRVPRRDDEPTVPMLAVEAPPEQKRVIAPLVWSRDGDAKSILPVEIAASTTGIPHTIRRLRLPDPAPTALRLAVTPFVHDDLGSLLTKMGDGYRYTSIGNDDLLSLDTLKKFDVVFLTCADMYARDFRAADPLRQFVHQGGTLYASDLRGDLVLAAFPEFRSRMPVTPGVPQNIEATIIDAGLQRYLGRKAIPLRFEANDWRPAAFDGTKVTVCLKGAYRNNLGQTRPAPLVVKFHAQKGTVIFTSFHHVKNDSPIVRKLLDYLIFATVNARSESRVKDMMARSQFAPHDLHPAMMTAGKSLEAEHRHPGGALQIALGFENLGAKLKLTLRSPAGASIEHVGDNVYQIEVPNAAPGVWQYKVTPIDLPWPNFPVTLAISSAK